jgi:hypothetical protein
VAGGDRVLVDTSVWVGFLSGRAAAVAQIDALRVANRIVVCGQVLQEVLQGSRDAAALAKLEHRFAIWESEPEQPVDFIEAARLYARLRWKGITVPPSDCLIAAVALRCGLAVCADDPHFDVIPGLQRYRLPEIARGGTPRDT